MRIEGWRLTGFIALGLTAFFLGMLLWHGWSEETVRSLVRNSARSSVILFLLAFSASSLQHLLRRDWTRWLLRNRRYTGVAFAFSHFIHLLGLFALGLGFPDPFLQDLTLLTLIGGGTAYAFIAAMTATSFDTTRRWLGNRWWTRLHTAGSYYIWFIFSYSYLPRAIEHALYIPFAVALLAVLLLRLARAGSRYAA